LTETKVYDAQPDSILDFALRPDGKQFALARFDGIGLLMDPKTGKLVAQPLPHKPVAPKVERLTPSGGPRGKTMRVTVSGSNLDNVKTVSANLSNVKAELVHADRNTTKLILNVSIGEAVPIGVVQLTFAGDGGRS